MTPEQIRVAIAMSIGWKMFGSPEQMIGRPKGYSFHDGPCLEIPDYLSDRTAMYEVLGTLSAVQFHIFRKHLRWLVVKGYIHHDSRNVQNPVVHKDMFLAPLPLIARAYLMVKGLWVEDDT